MKRTTIMAEERTLQRLRRLAVERGVSLGAMIREALDEKIARDQPRLRFLDGEPVDIDLPDGVASIREFDERDLYRYEDVAE